MNSLVASSKKQHKRTNCICRKHEAGPCFTQKNTSSWCRAQGCACRCFLLFAPFFRPSLCERTTQEGSTTLLRTCSASLATSELKVTSNKLLLLALSEGCAVLIALLCERSTQEGSIATSCFTIRRVFSFVLRACCACEAIACYARTTTFGRPCEGSRSREAFSTFLLKSCACRCLLLFACGTTLLRTCFASLATSLYKAIPYS